jgi:hypothetical protein
MIPQKTPNTILTTHDDRFIRSFPFVVEYRSGWIAKVIGSSGWLVALTRQAWTFSAARKYMFGSGVHQQLNRFT